MKVRSTAVLVAVALAGACLAACSSGSTSAGGSTSSPSTSQPSTGSTSTASTSPGVTSTTGVGAHRCQIADLTAAVTGGQGGAGTLEMTIGLTSSSSTPCTLGGYPGLQLLAANGAKLPTKVVRKGNYNFTAMTPTTVILTKGKTAYFNLGYSDVPVGSETSCPTSASLEITPPNAYNFLTIPAKIDACGGGTIVVSPVFLATGANTKTTAPPVAS